MNTSFWANKGKPPLGVTMDYGHPLSQGLLHAVIFSEGAGRIARNVARPGVPAILTTAGGTYSAPQWGVGQGGRKVYFQGVDTQVNLGRALNITTETMTFAALIDRRGVTGNSYSGLVFYRGSQASGMNQSPDADRLGYHWNDAFNTYNYSGGPLIPVRGMALCAVAISGSSALLYVNGDATINAVTHSQTSFNSDNSFVIGTSTPLSYEKTFDGDIYAAWVWKRTLTKRELDDLRSGFY